MYKYIVILSIITSNTIGQNSSLFYNLNGKLIADTTVSISMEALLLFSNYEKELTEQVLSIAIFPEVCIENNISTELLAEFWVDSLLHFHMQRTYNLNGLYCENDASDEIRRVFEKRVLLTIDRPIKNHILYLPFSFLITNEVPKNKVKNGFIVVETQKTY